MFKHLRYTIKGKKKEKLDFDRVMNYCGRSEADTIVIVVVVVVAGIVKSDTISEPK